MKEEFETKAEELEIAEAEIEGEVEEPFPRPQVTPEDVYNARFSSRVRGYDREEVDAFLRVLAAELNQLIENQQLLQNQTPVDVEDEEPYAKLGSDAGKLMQLARDHADRMKAEAMAEISAERAAAATAAAEVLEKAKTEAAAVRGMAERDATSIKDDADRQHAEAQSRAREVEIETENLAARAQTEAEGIRAAAETEARILKSEVEEEAKRIKAKARADHTVLTREAHREANRIEREAKQRAELLKDEAEERSGERVRHARAEVRKLRDAESTLKKRIQALQETLDSLSNEVGSEEGSASTKPATVDLTDSRTGPA
jgi:DivIVA domain-containing protein